MYNSESVLENETYKIRWYFEKQTDHLMSVRRSGPVIVIKKKTHQIMDFAVPADCRVKLKENEKRDIYLDRSRELKILWNLKVTVTQMA